MFSRRLKADRDSVVFFEEHMNRSAGLAYQKRFVGGQLAYGGCADDAEKVINKRHLVSGDAAWRRWGHERPQPPVTIAVFTVVTQQHSQDRGWKLGIAGETSPLKFLHVLPTSSFTKLSEIPQKKLETFNA